MFMLLQSWPVSGMQGSNPGSNPGHVGPGLTGIHCHLPARTQQLLKALRTVYVPDRTETSSRQ